MVPNIQIALRIFGTQTTNDGLVPLVSIGVFPEKEGRSENLDKAPLSCDNFSYRIKHCADYIIYKLYDNKVRSVDSSRDGRFVLAMAVPRHLQFVDGKSPYEVITAIHLKFVQENMSITADGYRKFSHSGEIVRDSFMQLLSEYPVEECTRKFYVPMAQEGGDGLVQADTDEKLNALFRDSQYPEFAQFGEIEIARTCQSTVNIEIPRPRKYKVILNDKDSGKTLVRKEDSFQSEDYLHDDKYHTYIPQHVAFTLEDLLDSSNGSIYGGRVILDVENEVIKCAVNSEDKKFQCIGDIKAKVGEPVLSLGDKEHVELLLKNNSLKVLFGDRDISHVFIGGEPAYIYGKKIEEGVSLSKKIVEGYYFTVEKDMMSDPIKISLRVTPPRPIKKPNVSPVPAESETQTIAIDARRLIISSILPPPNFEDTFVELSDGNRRNLCQKLKFEPKRKKGIVECYEAGLVLDNDWKFASDVTCVLTYMNERGRKMRSSSYDVYFRGNEYTPIKINKDDFKEEKKHFLTKEIKNILVAVLVGLLFGGGIGFFEANTKYSSNHKDYVTKVKQLEEDKNTLLNENNNLKEENEILKKDLAKEKKSKSETTNQVNGHAAQKIDYKKQVVDLVNQKKWTDIESLFKRSDVNKQITSDQQTTIERLWWNSSRPYNPAQSGNIRRTLENKQFNSFEEIISFVENELPTVLNPK